MGDKKFRQVIHAHTITTIILQKSSRFWRNLDEKICRLNPFCKPFVILLPSTNVRTYLQQLSNGGSRIFWGVAKPRVPFLTPPSPPSCSPPICLLPFSIPFSFSPFPSLNSVPSTPWNGPEIKLGALWESSKLPLQGQGAGWVCRFLTAHQHIKGYSVP